LKNCKYIEILTDILYYPIKHNLIKINSDNDELDILKNMQMNYDKQDNIKKEDFL